MNFLKKLFSRFFKPKSDKSPQDIIAEMMDLDRDSLIDRCTNKLDGFVFPEYRGSEIFGEVGFSVGEANLDILLRMRSLLFKPEAVIHKRTGNTIQRLVRFVTQNGTYFFADFGSNSIVDESAPSHVLVRIDRKTFLCIASSSIESNYGQLIYELYTMRSCPVDLVMVDGDDYVDCMKKYKRVFDNGKEDVEGVKTVKANSILSINKARHED